MTAGPVDIALVRMPYSEIGQPSLALGLLKAGCVELGLSNRVLSANLWFAEEVGPAVHDLLFQAYSTTLLGEWTFAGALFPEFQPDDEAYLRKAKQIFELDSSTEWRYLKTRYPNLDSVALFREIRRRAPDFIDRTADRILRLDPKIVGCSSTFQQHCASLALLRAIKQRRPDTITMIGGANCEAEMGRATFEQFPFLDYVVSGEADGFFAPMCQELLESGSHLLSSTLPPGVWGPDHRRDREGTRRSSEGEVDGAPIARLDSMNQSPIPDFDDFFAALEATACLGAYLKPALPFQTARGCWWGEKMHCTFCGISRTAMKFRAKSADNVMEQMLALRDRYGIRTFQGTEYIFDYRFFDTLLPRLKELDSVFRFEVKANLKAEQLQAFIESGTIEVQPGVESLQDDILGLLKKGTTAFQNLMLLKRGRQIGLSIYWNLLHTIPGDRDEWYAEMAELLPLVHHLQPPAGFAQIHYDRFSPYWRDPAAHGLSLVPAFGYEHVYPYPPDVLAELAYFFETPEQRRGFLRYDPTSHPGLFRLTREVDRWRMAFHSPSRPRLVVSEEGDELSIEDTREAAGERRFTLRGLEREIYQAAEEGVMLPNLKKKLEATGSSSAGDQEVGAAIQSLLERKVVVRASGRLVALGIAAPDRPLAAETLGRPAAELNPTQGKLEADVALDNQRPSILLSCLHLPQNESLAGWLGGLERSAGASNSIPRQGRQPA